MRALLYLHSALLCLILLGLDTFGGGIWALAGLLNMAASIYFFTKGDY